MRPTQVNDNPSGFTVNFFSGQKWRSVSGFSIGWIFEGAPDGKMFDVCNQIGLCII